MTPSIVIIDAKTFQSRADLESYVAKQFGLTATKKVNVVIRGTRHELANIGLSEKMIFWGISCECTDITFKVKVTRTENEEKHELVDRGESKPFGINGQTSKSA